MLPGGSPAKKQREDSAILYIEENVTVVPGTTVTFWVGETGV